MGYWVRCDKRWIKIVKIREGKLSGTLISRIKNIRVRVSNRLRNGNKRHRRFVCEITNKPRENELKTVYQMVYRFVFVSHCSLHKSSAPGKTGGKASYNTRVTNIFRKRASELIPGDSYMCELGHFFSFYFAAYLTAKFLILMEKSGCTGSGYARKALLNFYAPFLN